MHQCQRDTRISSSDSFKLFSSVTASCIFDNIDLTPSSFYSSLQNRLGCPSLFAAFIFQDHDSSCISCRFHMDMESFCLLLCPSLLVASLRCYPDLWMFP